MVDGHPGVPIDRNGRRVDPERAAGEDVLCTDDVPSRVDEDAAGDSHAVVRQPVRHARTEGVDRADAAVEELVPLVLVQVAVFSSTSYGLGRVHERYIFYVAPLVFAVFPTWLELGLHRPRAAAMALAGAEKLLPFLLPSRGLANTGTDAPTLFAFGFDPAPAGGFDVRLDAFHVQALVVSAFLALWLLAARPKRTALLVVAAGLRDRACRDGLLARRVLQRCDRPRCLARRWARCRCARSERRHRRRGRDARPRAHRPCRRPGAPERDAAPGRPGHEHSAPGGADSAPSTPRTRARVSSAS